MQGMCHLSRGIIAQSLSMKTNTDSKMLKRHSEANAQMTVKGLKGILQQMHKCAPSLNTSLCDLPVAVRNNARASSTAGPRRTTRSVQTLSSSDLICD